MSGEHRGLVAPAAAADWTEGVTDPRPCVNANRLNGPHGLVIALGSEISSFKWSKI